MDIATILKLLQFLQILSFLLSFQPFLCLFGVPLLFLCSLQVMVYIPYSLLGFFESRGQLFLTQKVQLFGKWRGCAILSVSKAFGCHQWRGRAMLSGSKPVCAVSVARPRYFMARPRYVLGQYTYLNFQLIFDLENVRIRLSS